LNNGNKTMGKLLEERGPCGHAIRINGLEDDRELTCKEDTALYKYRFKRERVKSSSDIKKKL
jgi:hypothetical protein